MTDVARDPFSIYGHDGIVLNNEIVNDQTVEVLAKILPLVTLQAGADIVAPSDMMDGRIGAIRNALELKGLHNTGIMSYSASLRRFYSPFRDALGLGTRFWRQKELPNGSCQPHRSHPRSTTRHSRGC